MVQVVATGGSPWQPMHSAATTAPNGGPIAAVASRRAVLFGPPHPPPPSTSSPMSMVARTARRRHPEHSRTIRADWAYYTDSVRPLHSGLGVELVGEVSDGEKAAFLGGALALLFPIDWPEPFGLVRAEALACGTPVVAGRRGSVPESIIDGVTGLVGETDDNLVALCQRIHAIDRAPCRREATRRFSPRSWRRVMRPSIGRPS